MPWDCVNKMIVDAVNKSLALVLWAKDENRDDDVSVFSGVLLSESDGYYFLHKNENKIELKKDWLARVKRVPLGLKETLSDCDYQLSLTVGDVSSDLHKYEDFGLSWPHE